MTYKQIFVRWSLLCQHHVLKIDSTCYIWRYFLKTFYNKLQNSIGYFGIWIKCPRIKSSNFMHFRMWMTSRMYQKEVNFDLRILLKFCHGMTVLTGDLIHQNNTAVTFQFDYIIDFIGCFFFFKDFKFISQYNISYSIFFSFFFWCVLLCLLEIGNGTCFLHL